MNDIGLDDQFIAALAHVGHVATVLGFCVGMMRGKVWLVNDAGMHGHCGAALAHVWHVATVLGVRLNMILDMVWMVE